MSRNSESPESIDALLPLPTAVFHILIALADRDRHGYSIMQDVAARTDGKVQLSAGTLYSAIRRMLEQGLIEELPEVPILRAPTSAGATTGSPASASASRRPKSRRLNALVDRRERPVWCRVHDARHAVYRALLHCYPAAFRQEYGNQMLLMFAEQLGEARRTGSRLEQRGVAARRAGRHSPSPRRSIVT